MVAGALRRRMPAWALHPRHFAGALQGDTHGRAAPPGQAATRDRRRHHLRLRVLGRLRPRGHDRLVRAGPRAGAAALGSAIPEEGGCYVWVKRGLGEYWGFQAGWWSWLTTYVDSALYIALIMDYLSSWLNLSTNVAWLLGVVIIIILVPFVAITILGLANWHGVPWQPFAYPGQSVLTSIGYALAVGMWMYSGYDSMSVLAGEVENPRRVIPRALMIAMPLVVISYFVPTLAALGGGGRWDEWMTEGGISFVEIAEILGGSALGVAMLVAAVVSDLALYQEYLAQGSRPAYAMAADHLLPRDCSASKSTFRSPIAPISRAALIVHGQRA